MNASTHTHQRTRLSGYWGRPITAQWEPGVVLAVSTQLGWIPSMRSVPRVRLRIRGVEHQAVAGVDEAVSPSPTYRLNRGGDRQANNALYIVVLGRLRYDSRTRAY